MFVLHFSIHWKWMGHKKATISNIVHFNLNSSVQTSCCCEDGFQSVFGFKAVFESVDLDGPCLICESRGLNPSNAITGFDLIMAGHQSTECVVGVWLKMKAVVLECFHGSISMSLAHTSYSSGKRMHLLRMADVCMIATVTELTSKTDGEMKERLLYGSLFVPKNAII